MVKGDIVLDLRAAGFTRRLEGHDLVARHRRFIRRTPIDGDLLRHAMTTDRLGETPLGRVLVPLLREEEIDGLARMALS